jgi:hypothetical protein
MLLLSSKTLLVSSSPFPTTEDQINVVRPSGNYMYHLN